MGDVIPPHVEPVSARLGLVVGDLTLSTFEDKLSPHGSVATTVTSRPSAR